MLRGYAYVDENLVKELQPIASAHNWEDPPIDFLSQSFKVHIVIKVALVLTSEVDERPIDIFAINALSGNGRCGVKPLIFYS